MRTFKGLLVDQLEGEIERENARRLNYFLDDLSSGMRRITLGQVPDGSGNLISDVALSDIYWVLEGRSGNQVGYGGTSPSGTATISSTQNATKGFVYLTEAHDVAVDETNVRVGVGVSAPTARLHMTVPNVVGDISRPAEDTLVQGAWNNSDGTYAAGTTPPPGHSPNIWSYLVDSSNTTYARMVTSVPGAYYQGTCDQTPTDPGVTTGFKVRVSARMSNASTADARIELELSHTSGGSTFAYLTMVTPGFTGSLLGGALGQQDSLPLSSSFQDYEFTLNSAQVAGIVWANLPFKFSFTAGGGGNVDVDSLEIEVPLIGSGTAETLQIWDNDGGDSNQLDYVSNGTSLDLNWSGDNALFFSNGGGTSGVRLLTSSTNGRIEAGTNAGANLNLVLSGNQDSTGTLLTSKFSNTKLTGTLTINGGSPAAGYILESTDTNGLATWASLASAGIAPSNATYITISSESGLTAERSLAVGSDRLVITDNGANSTVSLNAKMDSTNWDWTRGITVYGTSDEVQLDLKGHSTQTNSVFRVLQNADSVRMFQVDGSGTVTVADTTHTDDLVRFQILVPSTQASNNIAQAIRAFGGGNFTAWSIGPTGANVVGDTTANGAAVVRLQINQGSGQSVDMLRVRNTAGTIDLVKVDSAGVFSLSGTTSGTITLGLQAAAGSYNFNLPTSAGTSGQPLLSGGGGSTAQTYGTLGAAAGGTGLTSYAVGDLIYASGTTTFSNLTIGASGRILTSSGTAPQWSTNASVVDTARTWSTLQTFPDNTFKVVGSSDATKTLLFELDGATAGADARFLWTGATDMDFTLPQETGTLAIKNNVAVQTWTGYQTVDADSGGNLTLSGLPTSDAGWQQYPLIIVNSLSPTFGVGIDATQQTVNAANLTIPNLAGTNQFFVVSNATQTLSNKTFGTTGNRLTMNTASVGVAFVHNSDNTKAVRIVGSGLATGTNNTITFIGTSVRDWQFEDCTGSLAITGNENKTAASNASSGRVAKFNLTGQTANIGATNITTSTAAGFYLVSVAMACTTANAGGGTISFNLAWTGDVAGATATPVTRLMTATGTQTGNFVLYLASGNLTFTVTNYAAGTYALRTRTTYLGP